MTSNNQIRAFRWISILEGSSFLVLLLIAMPLKYIWDAPQMVEIVGMLHGILFVLYILGACWLFRILDWKLSTLAVVCISSVLPLGPFFVERKYL